MCALKSSVRIVTVKRSVSTCWMTLFCHSVYQLFRMLRIKAILVYLFCGRHLRDMFTFT